MKDGYLTASGHNWVEGQGSGPRIDQNKDEEEKEYFDGALSLPSCAALSGCRADIASFPAAMGNKIDAPAKVKKASAKGTPLLSLARRVSLSSASRSHANTIRSH